MVEVKTLLVAATAPSDAVAASVPLAAPVAFPVAEAADDRQGWMATLLGVLLMALGLVSVLGSSSPSGGRAVARLMRGRLFAIADVGFWRLTLHVTFARWWLYFDSTSGAFSVAFCARDDVVKSGSLLELKCTSSKSEEDTDGICAPLEE